MKYIITYAILLASCLNGLNAQTLKAYKDAYEDALFNKDYYNAYKYASEALEFNEEDAELQYLFAEAARNMDAYTLSAAAYQRVLDLDGKGDFPKATFYLADMQQRLAKYDLALMNYEIFLAETDEIDSYEIRKANKEIKAIEWAQSLITKSDTTERVKKIKEDINTAYSEFGAMRYKEELYYSSLRFNDGESTFNPRGLRSKILSSDTSKVESLNHKTLHTAHTCFNVDGTKLYFTICEYDNSYDITCDIYYRSVSTNGSFGEPVKLPEMINQELSTSTQPNLGIDQKTGNEVLFFVSNREGGKGKFDIWYSEIIDEEYTAAINLDQVNTSENEVTPFFHNKTQKLYFSSDGYLGLGGYDIFEVYDYTVDEVQTVNIGLPVNSSYNDIYYVLEEDGSSALFSSNREGALFLEDSFEACCYDVYEAEIKACDLSLNALTFLNDGTELSGVTVDLIDANTLEIIESIETIEGNEHRFEIDCNREYRIIGYKEGVGADTINFTTYDQKSKQEIVKRLYLGEADVSEKIALDLSVFDAETLEQLSGALVKVECLNNITKSRSLVMNSYQEIILLDRDCEQYKITISKKGYDPQTIFVDTNSSKGTSRIVEKVYLERDGNSRGIEELSAYLPVSIYYDNDDPDHKNYALTTTTNYSDTYYAFMPKKETFKNVYAEGQSGDIKYQLEQEVEVFFENDVREGFEKLQVFASKLLELLRNGNNIEIAINGYTSPRASFKYNLALGQRRIHNVVNELADYGGGVLKPYLDSEQLLIRQISYGESMSNGKVSDSIEDERMSIYSPEASRARKVEIISINALNE